MSKSESEEKKEDLKPEASAPAPEKCPSLPKGVKEMAEALHKSVPGSGEKAKARRQAAQALEKALAAG